MKRNIKNAAAALVICAAFVFAVPAARALDLGDVLKKGAIGVAGGWLGVAYDGYTKVVPIVSIGDGARIGAAQVGANTQSAIDRTKAVAQLEGEFSSVRATALIPIDSVNPLKQFRRVKGVGVTAIINVKL